jgi:hypothetical protein
VVVSSQLGVYFYLDQNRRFSKIHFRETVRGLISWWLQRVHSHAVESGDGVANPRFADKVDSLTDFVNALSRFRRVQVRMRQLDRKPNR